MARLSDVIEGFIKSLILESEDKQLQIQRNELADRFSCAPSQINYVLTTRFSNEKGYLIESRRGGGGYIVIRKVQYDNHKRRKELIDESIGDSITYHNAIALLESLYDADIIDEREFEIIKMVVNERTLNSAENKNKLRADILKATVALLLS
jgi:Transcriptional repressor of class III stress genes